MSDSIFYQRDGTDCETETDDDLASRTPLSANPWGSAIGNTPSTHYHSSYPLNAARKTLIGHPFGTIPEINNPNKAQNDNGIHIEKLSVSNEYPSQSVHDPWQSPNIVPSTSMAQEQSEYEIKKQHEQWSMQKTQESDIANIYKGHILEPRVQNAVLETQSITSASARNVIKLGSNIIKVALSAQFGYFRHANYTVTFKVH